MVNHVASFGYMLPNMYLSVTDIANTDFIAYGCPAGPHGQHAKNGKSGGKGRHNLLSGLPYRCDSFTACMWFRLEPYFIICVIKLRL